MDAFIGSNGTIMKPLTALKDALKKKMNATACIMKTEVTSTVS